MKRADRILADAREQKAAMIPNAPPAHEAPEATARGSLVADPAAPFGFRVEDNPVRRRAAARMPGRGVRRSAPARSHRGDRRARRAEDSAGAAGPAARARRRRRAARGPRGRGRWCASGRRAGVPVLITALEHKAYENENANRILQKLSGQDFGFDSDSGMTARAGPRSRSWRDWWDGFQKTGAKLRGGGRAVQEGRRPRRRPPDRALGQRLRRGPGRLHGAVAEDAHAPRAAGGAVPRGGARARRGPSAHLAGRDRARPRRHRRSRVPPPARGSARRSAPVGALARRRRRSSGAGRPPRPSGCGRR